MTGVTATFKCFQKNEICFHLKTFQKIQRIILPKINKQFTANILYHFN